MIEKFIQNSIKKLTDQMINASIHKSQSEEMQNTNVYETTQTLIYRLILLNLLSTFYKNKIGTLDTTYFNFVCLLTI